MLRWFQVRWLALAENTLVLLLSVGCWLWWQPSLEETRALAPGWIFSLYLRNLVLMVLGVARVELQRLNALVGEADAVEGLPDELALVNKHTLTLINDVLLLGRDDAELQLRLGALLLRDGLHLLRLEVMLRTNGLLRQLLLPIIFAKNCDQIW